MRILQVLFILTQLPVAIVFRRKEQTAYLLYLLGRDGTNNQNEVKDRHHHPQTFSCHTEIDEDIQYSEYILA